MRAQGDAERWRWCFGGPGAAGWCGSHTACKLGQGAALEVLACAAAHCHCAGGGLAAERHRPWSSARQEALCDAVQLSYYYKDRSMERASLTSSPAATPAAPADRAMTNDAVVSSDTKGSRTTPTPSRAAPAAIATRVSFITVLALMRASRGGDRVQVGRRS